MLESWTVNEKRKIHWGSLWDREQYSGRKRTSNIYDVPGNENRHTSPNISCVSINIAKTKSTELNPPRTEDVSWINKWLCWLFRYCHCLMLMVVQNFQVTKYVCKKLILKWICLFCCPPDHENTWPVNLQTTPNIHMSPSGKKKWFY